MSKKPKQLRMFIKGRTPLIQFRISHEDAAWLDKIRKAAGDEHTGDSDFYREIFTAGMAQSAADNRNRASKAS